jgi:hypothetical protein
MLFTIRGRDYIDSKGLRTLAETYDVQPQTDGWRLGAGLLALPVRDRPRLPDQCGALYLLRGDDLARERSSWLARGLLPAKTLERWPGEPAPPAACAASCACSPCRQRHAHD